jgi:hypothetical protein
MEPLAERARRRIMCGHWSGVGRGADTRQGIRRPQGPSADQSPTPTPPTCTRKLKFSVKKPAQISVGPVAQKHGRPTDLKTALCQSAGTGVVAEAPEENEGTWQAVAALYGAERLDVPIGPPAAFCRRLSCQCNEGPAMDDPFRQTRDPMMRADRYQRLARQYFDLAKDASSPSLRADYQRTAEEYRVRSSSEI